MNEILNKTGKIQKIHTRQITISEPFIEFASRFSNITGTVLLMSGGDLDCAEYHILAACPWLTFSGRFREMEIAATDPAGKQYTHKFDADPFDTLSTILKTASPDISDLPGPVNSGLFGYLSYDLKDAIEELPRTSVDDLCLPYILFFAPSIIVTQNKKTGITNLHIPERTSSGQSSLKNDQKTFQEIISAPLLLPENFSGNRRGLRSNFTRDIYMDMVEKIREYITSGHVYQVNMSQRFETDFEGNSFCLFQELYKDNPAPFFSYINAGDHHIVSTSPERFIKREGPIVETRPIKGTMPRGKTGKEDRRLGQELLKSRKDDAELSMIVDLLRNDIGKVCKGGSVQVVEHKRLEAYENVFHLISIVRGDLAEGSDSVDLIRAVFPGGSITGCPKIRAMEIIDQLEPQRRHIYTGSIGYISFHDTMDLSIAIRTATVIKDRIIFSVGGGIVYDSDPAEEFNETLHKGKTLMKVFKKRPEPSHSRNHVWLNGNMCPADEAAVPVTGPGFQYGFGFFETIRAYNGEPGYLEEHLERFHKTWKELFKTEFPDLSWEDIIGQVLTHNRLENRTAAVKILAARGDRETPPFNHTLFVSARPYTPRLAGTDKQCLDLVTYPESRQTPLADHKTLNYLFYLLAGKWAKGTGADEALIINPDMTISETNTANIFMVQDKNVIVPDSPHVLPGVMQGIVSRLLTKWGYRNEKRKILPEELFSGDEVIITNSLIGAIPVISLDNRELPRPSDLCEKINTIVLNRAG